MKKSLLILCILGLCFSCQYITELDDISTQQVVPLAPNNNTVLDTLQVTFTWQALEDSEEYHLQVASPNFEQATQVVIDTILSKTSYQQKLPKLGEYQWRIQARNSGYRTGYTTKTFRIEK